MKKILILPAVLIGLAILFASLAPSGVKAATVAELQQLIASLQAQINQLIAQLAEQQGGATPWCHNFNTNLGIGSSGTEFEALQAALIKDGANGESLSYDSVGMGQTTKFGEYTASAIVAFQEKYASEVLTPLGLKHGTGYLGNSTRAKLNKLYGCGQPVNPPQPTTCAKEGERLIVCTGSSGVCTGYKQTPCCSGLTRVLDTSLLSDGTCSIPFSSQPAGQTGNEAAVCTACGNGVCGAGENSCNCIADCK